MSHAIERAKERYGLSLTFADMKAIKSRIKRGKRTALFLEELPGNRKLYAVLYGDRWLLPVICPDGFIITFLPEPLLDKHQIALFEREVEIGYAHMVRAQPIVRQSH